MIHGGRGRGKKGARRELKFNQLRGRRKEKKLRRPEYLTSKFVSKRIIADEGSGNRSISHKERGRKGKKVAVDRVY